MNNKIYIGIILLCFKTLISMEYISTITKKTQQCAERYLNPPISEIPSTAFMYNTSLIFDYYLNDFDSKKSNSLQSLCDLPTINFFMQIINQVYPLSRFTLLSNNSIALTIAYEFYKLADKSFLDKPQCTYRIFKSVLPLCICAVAFYNDPSLFTHYTYVSAFDFFNDYITVIPVPCKILYPVLQFYHALLHDNIIKYQVIKNINDIFAAKKAMFLCATILACFNIKLKDKALLINPLYWLSIGLVHVCFTQCKWTIVSDSRTNFSLDEELLSEIIETFNLKKYHNFSYTLLKYTVHNAIPFLAVLGNMIYDVSFVRK